MSRLDVNTLRHTAGSADNITLDNSQNVTIEGNLTVDGTLSGVSLGAALTGSTNNTICTVTGASAIQGEANLTFDGSKLHTKSGSSGQSAAVAWADDLVVEGSGDSGITILSGNTADASLCFGDDGDADIGRVVYNHNSNFMGFDVSAASRMKVKGDGDVEIVDGDLVIGTAGHGIDFSAQTVTSVSGTTASQNTEVLDHYEEGSWTPDPVTGDGNGAGTYIRIGNLVTITGYISPNTTSGSDNVKVQGIPYPCDSGGGIGYMGPVRGYNIDNINGKRAHVCVVDTSDHVQFGTLESANAWTMLKHDQVSSSNNALNFTITYRTDG